MLAILIVNYKSEKQTISYVKNELSKIISPHIIVIVNNEANFNSNDLLVNELNAELVENIETYSFIRNRIYIISDFENLGYAKGNNLAAFFCNKFFAISFFLFSNNDILFKDNDVVEQLLFKIIHLNDVSIIGPKVIGLDNKNQSPEPYYSFLNRYFFRFWLTPFLTKKLRMKILRTNYSENAIEGYHYKIMGSFFLMNAKDFFDCDMMDSNTFLYAEEIILSERIKLLGKKNYYLPSVTVIHAHGVTTSKFLNNNLMSIIQFKSEFYYYNKYIKVSKIVLLIGKISFYIYISLIKLLFRGK